MGTDCMPLSKDMTRLRPSLALPQDEKKIRVPPLRFVAWKSRFGANFRK